MTVQDFAPFVVGLFFVCPLAICSFSDFMIIMQKYRKLCFRVTVAHFYTPSRSHLTWLALQTPVKVGVSLQASVDFLNLPSECCSFLALMSTTLQQNAHFCFCRYLSEANLLHVFLVRHLVVQFGSFWLPRVLTIRVLVSAIGVKWLS